MDLKLLKNFLMVAKTGNMTRASAMLFITQSALSKQMKELESEFGCTFFERIGGGMKLTEEGLLLQLLAFRRKYPGLRCHVTSGMTEQVTEKMDGGLLDFVIISGLPDTDKYNYIRYPADDIWGMVVRRDHQLAAMDKITIDDLLPYNIIISTQGLSEEISGWCGDQASELKVTDTVNLAYNGSRFVRENIAVMLTYKGLVDTSPENGLVWIPLYPELSTPTYLIWRKFQVFTPIVERFLEHLVTAFKKLSPDSSDND